MRLEHHLVGGYVRYISPHIIIIIIMLGHRLYLEELGCQLVCVNDQQGLG